MIAKYEISRERDENLLVVGNVDHTCPAHFHRKVELLYIDEGEKCIVSGNKEILLNKDNIFIADSYSLHSYKESDGGTQTVVVFPNRMLQHYYDEFGGSVLGSNVIEDAEFCRKVKPLFDSLADKTQNALLYQATVDMLLGSIVGYVGIDEQNLCDRQSFVERVLEYIDDNFRDELTLESMAEHFGYSKYYFSHLFNTTLGTSITDYISTIRLEKVLEKLKTDRCTVSDAVYECGFSSIPTFYRALKKNYNYKRVSDIV